MNLYELSERLNVPYATVWEQARRNALPVPTFKVGRRYFVSRRAYELLMARQHEPHAQSA